MCEFQQNIVGGWGGGGGDYLNGQNYLESEQVGGGLEREKKQRGRKRFPA